jgi:AcrR family transcriptional regulator
MTDRRTREERRAEVVSAALDLLADTPLDALSQRQLAKRLGVSQPGLFRYFRSRETMLLAVIEHARADLGADVAQALRDGSAVDRLRSTVRVVLEQARVKPGLPRLLFTLSQPPDGPVGAALAALAMGQRRLLQSLIEDGCRDGELQADPVQASGQLLALVQGTLFQWLVGGRTAVLDADTLVDGWMRGVLPHYGAPKLKAPARSPGQPEIHFVDAAALLGKGIDPLDTVLKALEGSSVGSVLRIDAPFRPEPLIALLGRRGRAVTVQAMGPLHALLVAEADAELLDLRELEAPEPMERLLLAAAALGAGERMLAQTPRVPQLLLPRLANDGVSFAVRKESDGTGLLLLWREA